jgi:hypothetical protein
LCTTSCSGLATRRAIDPPDSEQQLAQIQNLITWQFEDSYRFAAGAIEADVLAKYSTPGLRKNQLTRRAKKEQGMARYPADRNNILEQLYRREL